MGVPRHLSGGKLAVVVPVLREPCVILGPFVYAAACRTLGRGNHGRKLVDVARFDSRRHRTAGGRALDHEDAHDPLLSVADAMQPHDLVATVTRDARGRHPKAW